MFSITNWPIDDDGLCQDSSMTTYIVNQAMPLGPFIKSTHNSHFEVASFWKILVFNKNINRLLWEVKIVGEWRGGRGWTSGHVNLRGRCDVNSDIRDLVEGIFINGFHRPLVWTLTIYKDLQSLWLTRYKWSVIVSTPTPGIAVRNCAIAKYMPSYEFHTPVSILGQFVWPRMAKV